MRGARRTIPPVFRLAEVPFALLLLSCAQAPPVRIERTSEVEYPAKRSPFEVAVLREPPEASLLEIATLSAVGTYHQTTDQLLALLREHAALLGADGVIREGLPQRAHDQRLRAAVELGDQINHTFVFDGLRAAVALAQHRPGFAGDAFGNRHPF